MAVVASTIWSLSLSSIDVNRLRGVGVNREAMPAIYFVPCYQIYFNSNLIQHSTVFTFVYLVCSFVRARLCAVLP